MKPIIGLYGIQDRKDGPHPLETHDHAICRIEDGRVVRHLALERWTRRKHDNRLHVHIEELAPLGFLARSEQATLACADSFVGRAFVSQGGRWRVEAPPADTLAERPVQARAHVMGRELDAWIVPHELAHLSSSLPFLGSWEDGTLLVHVDGAASRSCCSAWLWREGRLRLLHHGWDLSEPVAGYGTNNLAQALVGHTWQTFLAVPGKLMGLAAWGRPAPEVRAWLDRHGWFARLREGLGPFEQAARKELGWDGQFTPNDPLIRTIAACFQERFEDAVLGYVEQFAVATSAKRLVLAGGGALNLPSNQRLADAGWFDHVFVPPCASDDGLALGAASLVSLLRDGPLTTHGPFLNDVGAPALGDTTEADICALADAIASGRVVGTCLGAGEVGPRALGHRSLLVRPTEADAKRLSVTLKGREPWRPVAPLVLAELADDLFEGAPSKSSLAEFMLGRFVAKPAAHTHAPGVVHADGTARVQTVGTSPQLRPIRRLLEALWERHRIPCVVNTSFNRRGEPLVQTLAHAREAAAPLGVELLWQPNGVELVQGCSPTSELPSVSADLVTWRADALHASVEVGLFDALPTTSPWLFRALSSTDHTRPTILLMRHAARGPLPADGAGADVPLLPEGATAAHALGKAIGARLTTLRTSPVLRCVQTAQALQAGAERAIEPLHDQALGDPGLFVADAEIAWQNWVRLGHEAVMATMISGLQLPGMAPPRQAAQRLIAHIIETAGKSAGVHVFVTHDSLLAATVAHTLNLQLQPPDWPTYLEALLLVPSPHSLEVRWRDQVEVIPWA
jgi:carbamoyltransferase